MYASSPLLLNLVALAALPAPCTSFSVSTCCSSASVCRGYQHDRIDPVDRHHRRLQWQWTAPLRMLAKLDNDDGGSSDHNENNDDNMKNVQIATDKFISTLQASLDDGTFESFTLKGPSAPRKRRKKGGANDADAALLLEQQKERLRGKYKTISGRLVLLQEKKKKKKRKQKAHANSDEDANNDDTGTLYVQSTIKYHLATDVAKNWKVGDMQPNTKQTEVEAGLRQLFSTAMGSELNDKDSSGGAPLSEWGAQNIRNGELGILAGELVTSESTYKLQLQPHHKASFRLSKKKQSNINGDESSSQTTPKDLSNLSHDRSKNVPLSPSSEFFQKLGVTKENGKPVNGMASKLRQCQKFVEIVGSLVDNHSNTSGSYLNNLQSSSSSEFPSKIRVVDMGCGRGYLTFSLHSYLSSKFGMSSTVETQGIDRRPKLIEEINGIAKDLGGAFSTLHFIEGTIGQTRDLFGGGKLTEQQQQQHSEKIIDTNASGSASSVDSSLDVLMALHACDTATDDALWFAIARDVDIIVLAPCCQHELRPQIDHHASINPNHPLNDILRHAIYRERATETVTDAMRAILLEIAGYDTNVFEFIGGEHTAKNVMITATKVRRRSGREQEEWLQDKRQRLVDLAKLYGIKRQRLATLMGESISSEGDAEIKRVKRSLTTGMAPLDV